MPLGAPSLPRASLTLPASVALISLLAISLLPIARLATPSLAAEVSFRGLGPGLEYATIGLGTSGPSAASAWASPATTQPVVIHLVRIDAAQAPLRALFASAEDGQARTAAEWCRSRQLAVAINLGMYQTDRRSNVGYARAEGHLNNRHWSRGHKSALAFGAGPADTAGALLLDLDQADARRRLESYSTVIQNLRLIRSPGESVWRRRDRRWSEAAVARDRDGRILFVFSSALWTMTDWNAALLELPLSIETAMHVEGGSEASLSIHAGGVDLDLAGSYDAQFFEGAIAADQAPIPNVLGVAARSARR